MDAWATRMNPIQPGQNSKIRQKAPVLDMFTRFLPHFYSYFEALNQRTYTKHGGHKANVRHEQRVQLKAGHAGDD